MADKPRNPGGGRGQPWSPHENDLIVAEYFAHLQLQLRGENPPKTERRRALAAVMGTGRSDKSIERKLQNVSAVLALATGHPLINGYVPMANVQKDLYRAVEEYLQRCGDPLQQAPVSAGDVTEIQDYEQLPELVLSRGDRQQSQRLIRKFDPAERDLRNRQIGLEGERRIFEFEKARLCRCNRPDLAERVVWVSRDQGDGAGFDILSFDLAGNERHLEVKATPGHSTTPFYLTRNELAYSNEERERFRLIRLYDLYQQPRAFELKPPLDGRLVLDSLVYRASF